MISRENTTGRKRMQQREWKCVWEGLIRENATEGSENAYEIAIEGSEW